ncbi:TorD/DmsD family molecular chaperone [Bacillus marasmi]|uniref:TorD/DmsD family molecular chaperone n=1 Tax=Bacillus marasmi TaxID=1926279 RepID=UPI0011C99185|nr:molecular chaperone TorD family protein [Bacillus marasmi]
MEAIKQRLASEDVLNILYARDFAYDILRRFFIEEPSQIYLKPFIQENMIELFPFQEDSFELSQGVNEIKEYFKHHDVIHNRGHFEDLHWDYTKMFVGPFELLASPWESIYVRKDKLLFQKTTMDIRKLYEKYRLRTSHFNIEAEDHIGLELDFMYQLNHLCIESCEQQHDYSIAEMIYLMKEQHSFLNMHLLKFAPHFSDNVCEHAETDFFKGMAIILKHFLLIDSKVLEELLKIEIFQK